MDIAGIGASPSRLLEALEKLGVSQGAELRSPGGPSGMPDAELVRAFLEALEGPGAGPGEGLGGDAATGGQPFAESGAGQGGQLGQPAVPGAEGPASLADPDAAVRLDDAGAAIRPVDDPSRAASPDGTRGVPERIDGVQDAPPAEAGGLRDGAGQVERAGRAEQAGQIEQAERAGTSGPEAARGADAPATPDGQLREVAQLLDRVASGQATPTELYRLQYMVGMLRVQASSGVQVSQQGSQGMEALLRQQG
ncbi:hypothetical protein [Nitratidesulfovibrio sp. SRB-5]|uniref:hypothetical protein n=1 Tax=Nitratidesulfovibrio sp. SRB-5 TaxID=2872636 RepID=UPI0010262675|nr:hypothetical protein [Nitratidesulfovibrio sp. SRB-5]MBZ2170599.1 hypothetical protein [Nitratidesulfovibrio sp. SRB-5]RXF76473.1 hypothetical protein EKK70_11575 [Desulfovibrio sp. DS-1]